MHTLFYTILISCLSLSFCYEGMAQSPIPGSEKAFDSTYQRQITQEMLFGVYIPVDLQDAFRELVRLSSNEDLEKFRSGREEVVVPGLHFGLGRWVAHNWNFYSGSRFSHHLKDMGLNDPDMMIKFVLTTFHRHLNKIPLEKETLIQELQEQEKNDKEKRLREAEILKKEVRKREPDN